MIENQFFKPDQIQEIFLQSCSNKVEQILQYGGKKIYFLSTKEGYEGIFAKDKKDALYYAPLLDIRNSLKQIRIERNNIKVILNDNEFFILGFSDENLSLFEILSADLERIKNTKYSPTEIKKYNKIIDEKATKNLAKIQGNKKPKFNQRLIFLIFVAVALFVYTLYNNLKQSGLINKPKYELSGLELSNLPYQDLEVIYNQGLTEQNKCKSIGKDQQKLKECFKSLEANIYYYNQPVKNANYDPKSQFLSFDCNFDSSTITQSQNKNNIVIKIENEKGNSYQELNTNVINLFSKQEGEIYQRRVLDDGQCTYILSGIKESFLEKVNNREIKVIVPVKLDFYMWFKDDFSILYHQEILNHNTDNFS
jgi:hypothetical protein